MRKHIWHSVVGKYFANAPGSSSVEKSDGESGNMQVLGLSKLPCARSNDDVGPVANYLPTVRVVQSQTANDLFHALNQQG